MKIGLRPLAALLLAGTLAACDTPPSREPFATLTYAYLPPYRLAVGRIEVIESYRSSNAPPHVELEFPVSPAHTAAQWGHDRLQATGGTSRAVYSVLRGDALETRLPASESGGLLGSFDAPPPTERYDLTIAVRLQIVEPGGRIAATVDAKATRSVTLTEDATLNDRERAGFALTEATMKDLNAALEKSIPQYLRGYLR